MIADRHLDQLREALAEAAAMEATAGAHHALNAAYSMLLEAGISRADLRPIFHLGFALEDHMRGKRHPLLAVQKRPGNRGHAADDQFKAAVAAVVTLAKKAGHTKEAAERFVATRLKLSGVAVSKKNIDSWHREISSERHTNDAAVESYRHYLKQLEPSVSADPAKAMESALAALVSLPRTKL